LRRSFVGVVQRGDQSFGAVLLASLIVISVLIELFDEIRRGAVKALTSPRKITKRFCRH
jgi:hypothetical protein